MTRTELLKFSLAVLSRLPYATEVLHEHLDKMFRNHFSSLVWGFENSPLVVFQPKKAE